MSLETAGLPAGWRERLVIVDPPAAEPGRGLCLEPHDCAVAKLVAARHKDHAFVAALVDAGLIDPRLLLERIAALGGAVGTADRNRMTAWVQGRTRR